MKWFWVFLMVFAALSGCGEGGDSKADGGEEDAGDDAGGEETTGDTGDPDTGTGDAAAESLDIAGIYATAFGSTITVSDTLWADVSEWGTYEYEILNYDNEARYLIADNGSDELFSRFEWVVVEGVLFYCQIVYDAATPEEAGSDVNLADAGDVENGCNGFPWTDLTPAG